MKGLSPSTYKRLRSVLLDCGPFANDRELQAVFVDTRVRVWREALPNAGDPASRVDMVIDYMGNRYSDSGKNALALLLQVLCDRTDPGDLCHRRLAGLANELEGKAATTRKTEATTNESHSTVEAALNVLVQEIKDRIAQNRVAEALELYREINERSAIAALARLERTERQFQSGMITNEQANLEQNRLVMHLLDELSEFEV